MENFTLDNAPLPTPFSDPKDIFFGMITLFVLSMIVLTTMS